ncbi:hypothetical protein X777_07115 [Ooceraea biroi]|uniref:Uncharacterized protein n=1 Tax=Ooceraea biroi TaxID=2015173 RepID=A0A026WCG0_OOCBI|nr:hypothetical protein X777_07115 [Ooceraea biroi]
MSCERRVLVAAKGLANGRYTTSYQLDFANVISRLTNLFTVPQEENHQQDLMGGRFECLVVNNVPGVLGKIDVGGSADSTGVWIWTLLPTKKRAGKCSRARRRRRTSLFAPGRYSKTKSECSGRTPSGYLRMATTEKDRVSQIAGDEEEWTVESGKDSL